MVVIFGDMDEGLPVLHDLSKTAKKDDRAELLNQGAVDQRHLEDNGEIAPPSRSSPQTPFTPHRLITRRSEEHIGTSTSTARQSKTTKTRCSQVQQVYDGFINRSCESNCETVRDFVQMFAARHCSLSRHAPRFISDGALPRGYADIFSSSLFESRSRPFATRLPQAHLSDLLQPDLLTSCMSIFMQILM
jgi:hypothetical protein